MKFSIKIGRVLLLPIMIFIISCGTQGTEQSVKINTSKEVEAQKANTPDITDSAFKDGMTGKVFHNYLQVKYALTNSDIDGAQTAAGNLEEAFTDERASLKNIAKQIAKSDNIDKQRQFFSDFTKLIEPLFKDNLSGGTIYKQYCPMAFDNTGAEWFSDVPEIRNPYFGEKMLKCGKVVETIQ